VMMKVTAFDLDQEAGIFRETGWQFL